MSEFGNPLNLSTGNRVVLSGVAKTTKPGWLARLSYVEPGSFGLVWIDDPECFSELAVTADGYITIARFSNSYCRTGIAQPADSTRPAASRAAVGDTP